MTMNAIDMTAVFKDAPRDEWIALSKSMDRIVGTGKTVEEAIEAARKNGEEDPIVTGVPPAGGLIL